MESPTASRILMAAVLALSSGLGLLAIVDGFSTNGTVKFIQGLSLVVLGLGAIVGVFTLLGVRLAGWSEPENEEDFDRIVERSERLARQGTAADPEEIDFLDLDPYDDEDFDELVSEALDDLPDLLQRALEGNVAVIVSDQGRKYHAYGLYVGDTIARDDHADRVLIFRDTLRRDFGHDPELLRHQVTITVRHELAHHLGADELGVRELGL